MRFTIPDMSCGHCVAALTKAVRNLDPRAELSADLATRTVSVTAAAAAEAVSQAMAEAGYPNRPA